MPTPFQTLLIVGIAICSSHLITAFFESLVADMLQLPCLPCPKGHCNSRSPHIGVCSHRLRKLYETSTLEEKELKEELKLWHSNGAKVNQVGAGCRKQVLEMANEIAQVLQEILKGL